MRASPLSRHAWVLFVFLCVPVSLIAKKNPADYQLRLHIYETHWNQDRLGFHAFGRANLFDEQGAPHGVEFTYDCMDHLMASTGNEAYPAKWKKQGQSIELIFGEIGSNPDSFHSCEFKVALKQYVYFRGRGELSTGTPQEFKDKHQNEAPPTGVATGADVPVTGKPSNY